MICDTEGTLPHDSQWMVNEDKGSVSLTILYKHAGLSVSTTVEW